MPSAQDAALNEYDVLSRTLEVKRLLCGPGVGLPTEPARYETMTAPVAPSSQSMARDTEKLQYHPLSDEGCCNMYDKTWPPPKRATEARFALGGECVRVNVPFVAVGTTKFDQRRAPFDEALMQAPPPELSQRGLGVDPWQRFVVELSNASDVLSEGSMAWLCCTQLCIPFTCGFTLCLRNWKAQREGRRWNGRILAATDRLNRDLAPLGILCKPQSGAHVGMVMSSMGSVMANFETTRQFSFALTPGAAADLEEEPHLYMNFAGSDGCSDGLIDYPRDACMKPPIG